MEKRQLFLGIIPPGQGRSLKKIEIQGLTREQNQIFNKILASPDYFLLWGPPGTGKTNVMLKEVVKFLFETSNDQILIVAYTNRAVDEICYALESLGPIWKEHYLRIGSRYSTHDDFKKQLLVEKIRKVKSRKALHKILAKYRIVVSTVTSLAGNRELFRLKAFDRLIVDEATQILEPLMAGIVPRVPWVLLIGDHQQLAAVVAQSKKFRLISDSGVRSIGLTDAGNSYFERLYKRCIEEGWEWAYDKLTYQGRMHKEIMTFPSEFFYQNSLKILPGNVNQTNELNLRVSNGNILDQELASKRVLFFPVESREVMTSKTNLREAILVSDIVTTFKRLYEENSKVFHENTLGVMTPYRAQIAQITQLLVQKEFDPGTITIDTVERYQGGARDIIIISLCANDPGQLATLVSQGEDGIDRKLNVALTRAREHLILIGDPFILSENPVYASFIERYQVEVSVQ